MVKYLGKMNGQALDKEGKILEAARHVFLQHGLEGASMQMIADKAGINKALLHYYYRSKGRLFEAVFLEAFNNMIPTLGKILESDMGIFEKIESFVDIYITGLIRYPQIPLFIMHELQRNPGRVVELISQSRMKPMVFAAQVKEEIRKGTIIEIDPLQLIVNLIALCIFPFAARPIIQGFIFGNDAARYDGFLESRKQELPRFIIQAIKKP
jgi:AcrR family transcriptional regulator